MQQNIHHCLSRVVNLAISGGVLATKDETRTERFSGDRLCVSKGQFDPPRVPLLRKLEFFVMTIECFIWRYSKLDATYDREILLLASQQF
jgi:hypothetical protein